MKKYIPTCTCSDRDGKTTILHNYAFVGVNTNFTRDGVFINNVAAVAENNFCPNCGAPRKVIETKNQTEESYD